MVLKQVISRSGNVTSFGIYNQDKRNGKYYEYYDNGLIKIEALFENDSLISEIKYNEKGLKIIN